MRKIVVFAVIVISIILLGNFAIAEEFVGWDVIRSALQDGDGAEFVLPVNLEDNHFYGITEIEAVQAVVDWIDDNYFYKEDTGEVWTDSSQTYDLLEGDCEDWAILLTALLRFHTQYGENKTVSSDKVWVSINQVTEKGSGVVAAHAWVGYKLDKGGEIHIEPNLSDLYRGRPKGMLNFNDEWVKGGGIYLTGK